MRQLGLRSRLLLGVGVIALVQVVSAIVVISLTSDRLIDQVDDRLEAAATEPTGTDGTDRSRLPGLSDVYQGVFTADGRLETLNVVVNRGNELSPPVVTAETVRAAFDGPVTVEARRSEDEYRLVAIDIGDGDALLLAGPLDGYEFTINRLARAILTAASILLVVLGAVTWWVMRLGIRPIKRMTTTAEAIASGDLSERIEVAQPGTEAGQLAAALNTMMGQIQTSFGERERSEERLRQFVADASHELRTPVATIRGYADLYQAGGLRDRAELDDAMLRTSQEIDRMSRLIADLLRLARLDREPSLRTDEVDLSTIARDTVADAAAAHPGRRVVLSADESVVVRGDDDLLRQALGNLVDNAIAHTDPPAMAAVTVRIDSTHATVSVSDDGDGMAPETTSRATERFYRGDPSRARHQGGSGLGLAIVDSIVAAHGGQLDLVSESGRGTTVTLSVPVDTQLAPSSLSAASEVAAADSEHAREHG